MQRLKRKPFLGSYGTTRSRALSNVGRARPAFGIMRVTPKLSGNAVSARDLRYNPPQKRS
jgi:hypothetical protein